jgi:hypothetical protein
MCLDALHQEESMRRPLQEEYQTEDGRRFS